MRAILPLIALLLSVAPTSASAEPSYPWLDSAGAIALDTRFAPPDGFERVRVSDGTYARWLRSLPTEPTRTTVLAHDGEQLDRPAAAIVRMDVGRGDLQQCADSTIRLHAEYQWASSRATEAAYHFTSGDRSTWVDWRDGERFEVLGATVKRVRGSPRGATPPTESGCSISSDTPGRGRFDSIPTPSPRASPSSQGTCSWSPDPPAMW